MDVFFVQVISCNSIRHRILGESLCIGFCNMNHFFGIDFDRFIVQLGLGNSLQTMRALWQIGISIDPWIAIQMRNIASIVLITLVAYTQLCCETDRVGSTTGLNERVVEHVSVERCDHCGFVGLDEISKSH